MKTITQAQEFKDNNPLDVADLMTALDKAGIESEQDYGNETTEWIFEDGSKIMINNFVVEVINN